MKAVQRIIGTGLFALALVSASGCILPTVGGRQLSAPARSRPAATASTYETTHCTPSSSGVFGCSSGSRAFALSPSARKWLSTSVPLVGACGERTQLLVSALTPQQACPIRLNVWTAVPTSGLMGHTEACVEPLLAFRLADNNSSIGIGNSAKSARILEAARHPAFNAGWQSMESSACNVISP